VTGRSWRIDLPCGPLLNKNDHRYKHWGYRDRITRQLRGEAAILAKAAKIPPLGKIRVFGWVIPPNRINRDPANWYDSAKACVDGLVDAGVVPDDNATYVEGPDMRLGVPLPCGHKPSRVHLRLLIEEL
jgi:hypothetical protein